MTTSITYMKKQMGIVIIVVKNYLGKIMERIKRKEHGMRIIVNQDQKEVLII